MNAKYVLVRDGVEESGKTVADHEALYLDGEKIYEGETEDRSKLVDLLRIHGVVEDEVPTVNLGPKDVDKLVNSMEFPTNLSDFEDTELPTDCGCGPSCKGCGSGCSTAPAHTPRPERKIDFKPNNPDVFFEYEEQEYQLALERLRRYAEDWPEKRDDLLEKIAKMDPEKDGALGPVLSATSGWVAPAVSGRSVWR